MIKQEKKVVIFVGYACNNHCRFCIDLNKRHINHSTKQVLNSIYKAKKSGADTLEIIGGEVTIREDFWQIMEFIKALKFSNMYMVTNGVKFADKEFTQKLLDLDVLKSIVFSLHGVNAKQHNFLTENPISYQSMLKGIENFHKLGFPSNKMASNTAIEKGNYKNLLEIGKKIKELGLNASSEFIFADPNVGGVHDNFEKLMPKISESAPYIRELLDWGNQNDMTYRVRYVPLCYFADYIESNNISELMEVKIYSNVTHSAPDFHNADVVEGRQQAGRKKTSKCEGCKLYDICEGLWTTYLENRGDDELQKL